MIIKLLTTQSILSVVEVLNVIVTSQIAHCYLQFSFYPIPRSAQIALKTVALVTFTVLTTTHYDSKEYTELPVVHRRSSKNSLLT